MECEKCMSVSCEKCMTTSMANYKAALASKHRTIVLLFILLIVQFVGLLVYIVADNVIDAKNSSAAEDEIVLSDDASDCGYIYAEGTEICGIVRST